MIHLLLEIMFLKTTASFLIVPKLMRFSSMAVLFVSRS